MTAKKGILVARPQHVTMGSRTVAAPPGSSEMKRDTSFGDTLNLSFIDDSDIDEISRSPSHKSKSSFPDYYHAPNASFDSSTKSDPVIDRDPAGKGSSPTKERKKDNSKPDMEKKPTGKATTKTPEPRPILAPTEIQVDVKEPLHETPRSRVVHYFPCCAISCDQLKAVAIVLFAFVLAIIVIVVISTTTQKNTQAFEEASATVFIGCGLVTGKHEGDVLVFRGIPYAEPPVGTMRWRPPNPLHSLDSCWNGTFDGTKAAPACYQGEGTMKELSPLKGNMSEDCLTLNVWTPDLKRQKHTTALPVVVYIHGDQFIGRDEDTLEWGPNAQQAKITNMVWVSFNYRVGALGFLALDGLASNSHSYTSGNYGLMDQIAALEWVRDNIRAFGGDPESVTLLGQGSGATSIVALLTTPLARGLYHAAWLSSPAAGFNPRTRAAIYQDNLQLMSNLGCNDVECARRQPPATVMQAFQPTLTDYTRMPTPDEQPRTLAIVDGHIVAADIVDLWQRKIMNDVPIIIGASSLDIEVPNLPSSDADVTVLLEATFRPFGATVWEGIVEHYGHSNNTAGHWKRKVVEQILADLRVTCPLERLFAVARLAFHSAHFYVYDYQPDRLLHRHKYGRTSRRGVDVAALLGQLEGPGKADEQFTLLLVNSFIRFAQTHRMPTEWQVGKMGEIGQDLTPREMGAARMERCHFWTEEAGFYPQHAKFD